MGQPEIRVPRGAVVADGIDYNAADGVEYIQSWLVGFSPERSERVFKHEFRLVFMGESEMFGVVAEESASESQIEDMAAWVSERTATKISDRLQRRGSRLPPERLASRENWGVRRELAAIWRDYRSWANRRHRGGTARVYVPGLTSKD